MKKSILYFLAIAAGICITLPAFASINGNVLIDSADPDAADFVTPEPLMVAGGGMGRGGGGGQGGMGQGQGGNACDGDECDGDNQQNDGDGDGDNQQNNGDGDGDGDRGD